MVRKLPLLLAICLGAVQCVSAENAEMPYKSLDQLCEIVSTIDQTKLAVIVRVGSTNKSVNPADIRRVLFRATGAIPVEVSTNGQILNFPHRKELAREDPPIVSNQPKGSLIMTIFLHLVVPDSLSFRYARLADGVAEVNKAIKAQAGFLLSFLAPKAEGVVFLFPKTSGGKAKVEIESASGHKEYLADTNGVIKLKLEKSLLKENPEVKMSERPLIVPDVE